MMQAITFSSSPWFIGLCLILGALVSFWFYFKDRTFQDAPKWARILLPILRGIAIASIGMLLLTPMTTSIEEDSKKPIIVLAQDISKSVVINQSQEEQDKYSQDWSSLKNELNEKFDIVSLAFSDKTLLEKGQLKNGNVTNIAASLNYIEENYADQHVGAIVLASDGIYNEGNNPIYNSNNSTPIYTVALGDTTIRKDLYVKQVFHNKISYLGDKTSVQIDIAADNASNQTSLLTVKEISSNKKIASKKINIKGNDFFQTVTVKIPTLKKGIHKYRIALSAINNEITKSNNFKDIYIEVIDGRQKILILADGPHPDIATFRDVISNNKNYKVETALAKDNINTRDFDFIILHNLPSAKHPITDVLNTLERKKIGRLFVIGAKTDIAKINQIQSAVSISSSGDLLEDVQADAVKNFNDFTVSEELKKKIGNYPPLLAPFGSYSLNAGSILLKQNIKGTSTQYPLLAFGEERGAKVGVLSGEGIYKWKYFNYIKDQNSEIINELVNKTIQLLTVKDDKRKFRVNISKNLFKENENIVLDAQLYNNNYELINTPEATIVIKDKSGKEFPFTFTRTSNYYTLNAGKLPVGQYSYTGSTSYNNNTLSSKGSFSIKNIQLEQYDLVAKHDILRQLSNKSKGKMIFPDELSTLSKIISSNTEIKPIVYSSSKKSLLLTKWLPLFLLLFSLIAEWFIRRFMGGY